jgi:microcystin-dependent protein
MAKTSLRRGTQDEGNTDYFTGCPIGGGFLWYGLPTKIPSNCRICDNSTLAISSYAKLNENLGGAWGTSGGNINIPDLRGRFPRGVDGGIGNDPDRASRTAANTGGNTGDTVGSVQGHAMQGHFHLVANHNAVNLYGETAGQASHPIAETGYYGNSTIAENTSSAGENETRPKNANVYFVIRIE